jgi:hypothetical protein
LKQDTINIIKNEINTSTCLAVEVDEFEEELLDSYTNKPLSHQHNPFPIPLIDDILDRVGSSLWFSDLDLKSGYWQIEMHPDDIQKTAFTTQDGHYEFLRLQFGLKNAPNDFCRIMAQILGHLKFVEIYFDNITIHSQDFHSHKNH